VYDYHKRNWTYIVSRFVVSADLHYKHMCTVMGFTMSADLHCQWI